jgi:hypothetical protein
MERKEHHNHHQEGNIRPMAISATLHCLTGCSIGEVGGMIIGTALSLSNSVTILLSIILAFIFGFGLSTLPLLKAGIGLGAALSLVAAADTLSVTTMEIVDNLVVLVIPGAMDAGLLDILFWASMAISLIVAFFAALPVNIHLLKRGRGHAITMKALGKHGHHH